MTTLRLKLCGVNQIDTASLNSIIALSDSRLTRNWIVAQSGQIDLFIYGVDDEKGRAMLREHKQGASAILVQHKPAATLADFVIRKPIRTKQFAEILNTVALITEQQNKTITSAAKQVAEQPKPSPDPELKANKTPSLLHSLSKRFTRRKSPSPALPSLALYTPMPSDADHATIVETKALARWIATLPTDDHKTTINALSEKLIPLNHLAMSATHRLTLLEQYRESINGFIFNRDVDTIKLEMSDPTLFEANINQLNLFIEDLAIGYKNIVMNAYQNGLRPSNNSVFLFAIIRASELMSLLIINAFRHYRSTPIGAAHELHQLYLYCEADNVLDTKASFNNVVIKKPFIHYYSQIMLTGIADPYSLSKYEVFRLFNLMAKMATKISIKPLSDSQKSIGNKAVLAGNFCLDCGSDRMPIPLHYIHPKTKQLPEMRILNPTGVLFAIEQVFEAAANTSSLGRYNLDIQLLKKVSPQFNASYQRQYQRLSATEERLISIANGFEAIHSCLQAPDDSEMTNWTIINQGSGGLMIKCHKTIAPVLNIDDVIGIFEQPLPPKLATIRWLHIDDNNESVRVGLQIHPGHPAAVSLSPKGTDSVIKCLYLPPMPDIQQPETLVVSKGRYSPNRIFHLNDPEKTYTIVTQKLLNYSPNFEQFDYKKIAD